MRDAFKYTQEEFRDLWAVVRDFVVVEALDDAGKGQGLGLVKVRQIYQADEDGAFAYVTYLGCSDQYYDWWTKNEMDKDACHHFCR